MKILCINGQGGVGKDSFVFYCRTTTTNNVFNFSMVDAVKKVALRIGWDGKKGLKDRLFLSNLKDLMDDYNDYSFQSVLREIEGEMVSHISYLNGNTGPEDELICFVHAREPKDIKRWREQHGARAVLIRRPQVEGNFGNHADDQVFDCEYDYYIDNSGSLDELKEIATNFIKHIREEEWESNL